MSITFYVGRRSVDDLGHVRWEMIEGGCTRAARTIWESDGTNGPVLICPPPTRGDVARVCCGHSAGEHPCDTETGLAPCVHGCCDDFRSAVPSANFANTNARAVLRVLRLPGDESGALQHQELPAVQRRLIALLNMGQLREEMYRDPVADAAGAGPRFYDGGTDDDQALRRLRAVQEVITYARRNGYGVYWA